MAPTCVTSVYGSHASPLQRSTWHRSHPSRCRHRGTPEPMHCRSFARPTPTVTAVAAFDDDVALRTLAAMRDLKLTAPRDLAVIGFDATEYGALATPTTDNRPHRRRSPRASRSTRCPRDRYLGRRSHSRAGHCESDSVRFRSRVSLCGEHDPLPCSGGYRPWYRWR